MDRGNLGGVGRAGRRAGQRERSGACLRQLPRSRSLEPAASGGLIKSSLPACTHLTIVLFVVSGTKLSTNDETLINSFLKTNKSLIFPKIRDLQNRQKIEFLQLSPTQVIIFSR